MQTHTKGPWIWQSFDGGKTFFLGTPDRGRLIVMDFVRRGMQQAAPRFARRTGDEGGLLVELTLDQVQLHPDARLIAAAPDLFRVATAASHALRSYQFGNGATELAQETADHVDAVLTLVKGGA